jgi:hypothetical protein
VQHPKHHGCVAAEFVIADDRDLPSELRVGVFREPGRKFPAVIRFSNARKEDDRETGGHGMAIKLMSVEGAKLLQDQPNAQTQDFVLLDSPVFFIKSAIEYADFDDARVKMEGPASWLGKLSMLAYFARHLDELKILKKIEATVCTNPLESRYWSVTPYKFDSGAVKYLAKPRLDGPPIAAPVPSEDQLREAMSLSLRTRDAWFDFFVQRQVDSVKNPIEDPTQEWSEDIAPFRKVATIHIPRQSFESDARMNFCENLSFTPWHSLPDHQPLGGINRVRKEVYEVLSKMRHSLNNAPRDEPTVETVPPS